MPDCDERSRELWDVGRQHQWTMGGVVYTHRGTNPLKCVRCYRVTSVGHGFCEPCVAWLNGGPFDPAWGLHDAYL